MEELGKYIFIAIVAFIIGWISRRNKFEEKIQIQNENIKTFIGKVQGDIKSAHGDRKTLAQNTEKVKNENTELQQKLNKIQNKAGHWYKELHAFKEAIIKDNEGEPQKLNTLKNKVMKEISRQNQEDPDQYLEEETKQHRPPTNNPTNV